MNTSMHGNDIKDFDAATAAQVLRLAQQTLINESDAIAALSDRLKDDPALTRAVFLLLNCAGRVVVSGIGKSGHIGRKIAATLASTGTPALFIHPAEAAHGDLGMATSSDVFIVISYSGESSELMAILPAIKRMGSRVIAMTGNPRSSLAVLADIHLNVAVAREACTINLAPTTSTTVTLALGDAIAIALLDLRGFKEEDFARSHPGGALGRRLLTHVSDVMRRGDLIPMVSVEAKLTDALLEMTQKGMGMTAVIDLDRKPIGIFTDGDLRRMLESVQDFRQIFIRDVMRSRPHAIAQNKLAVDAVALMEQFCVNQLLVIDFEGNLTGALHIHDLTRAKVI
jgi:arabinose-5-phosphate isomerase